VFLVGDSIYRQVALLQGIDFVADPKKRLSDDRIRAGLGKGTPPPSPVEKGETHGHEKVL
jgi:hypothetical protein